jgi:hypothetical protein
MTISRNFNYYIKITRKIASRFHFFKHHLIVQVENMDLNTISRRRKARKFRHENRRYNLLLENGYISLMPANSDTVSFTFEINAFFKILKSGLLLMKL